LAAGRDHAAELTHARAGETEIVELVDRPVWLDEREQVVFGVVAEKLLRAELQAMMQRLSRRAAESLLPGT
jgi:hypothetical protein